MEQMYHKFGSGTSITSGETIICATHDVVGANPFPATGGALTFVSSATEDTASSSGTSTIRVEMLRGGPGSSTRSSINVDLDGTTPVDPGISDCFRVARMYALAGGENVGNIDALVDGNVIGRIRAGDGQTQSTIFSIADDERAFVRQMTASVQRVSGTAPRILVRAYTRRFDSPWRNFMVNFAVTPDGGSETYHLESPGISIRPGSDIKMEVESLEGATSVDVFGGYEIFVRGV